MTIEIQSPREGDQPETRCVVMTGSSGLVGRHLVASLEKGGHRVIRLLRRTSAVDQVGSDLARKHGESRQWDPEAKHYDPSLFAEADAVVHLAGENIASGRWTARRKQRIFQSRVETTRRIAEALTCLSHPPRDLMVASAVGYYGDRQDQELSEYAQPGEGFLSQLCQHWEAASSSALEAGVRVSSLRFGMILSRQGGALERMLGPFRWGLGGRLGSGQQFVSWIHLEDAIAAILFLLSSNKASGAYNLVAPQPLRNQDFVSTLGRLMGRPVLLPAPAWALRLALGEMADELLLTSTRAIPASLGRAGFGFRFATLEAALQQIIDGGS